MVSKNKAYNTIAEEWFCVILNISLLIFSMKQMHAEGTRWFGNELSYEGCGTLSFALKVMVV
jgi:uncharacterized membrane-anchored protein YitT (DUF2179 family)